jgi:hypothetical protein
VATEQYKAIKFSQPNLALIAKMNAIVTDLSAQGYVLTVRQLYYQMVSADHIENTMRSYKRLTSLVNDARLAGYMDWESIEDRTRAFDKRAAWESGRDILQAVAGQYHKNLWHTQPNRVFLVVEKDALSGVFAGVCRELDIPLLAAKGYPSVSVVRDFVKTDILPAQEDGKECVLLHFGDHDPSGIDMTRDLEDRIRLFTYGQGVEVVRCALNMAQVKRFKPPPNPAKMTDSRFDGYEAKFGKSSWELDAMKPQYLNELVREHAMKYVDQEAWELRHAEIAATRARLKKLADAWKDPKVAA